MRSVTLCVGIHPFFCTIRFEMEGGWIIVVEFFVLLVLGVKSYEMQLWPETPVIQRSEGTNLLLTCKSADAPSDSLLLWFDNNNTRVTQSVDGSNDTTVGLYVVDDIPQLLLRNMRKYYDGTYTCKLLVNGSVVKEMSRQIQLHEEFAFSLVPPKQYLGAGMEGLIVCEPKPGVQVGVVWRKDTSLLTEGGRYSFGKRGLTIRNVQFTDAGNYLCEIQRADPHLYQAQDIQVEVHVPVKITKEISRSTGVEGADFSLTCEASGDPVATFQFYFKGQIFKNGSRINVDERRGQVFFAPLRREDEGEVSCSAVNTVSTDNSTGYLTVQIPPSILSFPNATYKEGENATMECLVEGKPTPTLAIKKLSNSTYQSNHGMLNIINVTPDAAGLYVCEAYSSVGSDSMTNMVTVNFKPRTVPNQQLRWTTFVYLRRNMTCEVEAHPPPHFKWFFNGVELSDNETFKIFSDDSVSHLQIYVGWVDQAWVYGGYEDFSRVVCRSNNSEGSIDIPMTLERSGTPSELENVTLKVYPCQVDFYFSTPYDIGDEPLDRIVVDIFLNESRNFPWGNHLKINKLKPNTYYEMGLSAASAAGEGEVTEVEFTTSSPSAPYAIQLIRSKDVPGADSYRVEWEEPVDTCLPITKFKIRYRRIKLGQTSNVITPLDREWTYVNLNDGSARTVNLTGLLPDSYYLVEVLAVNNLGSSKHSGFATIKTVPLGFKGAAGKSPVVEDSPFEKPLVPVEVLIAIIVSLLFLFLVLVDVSCYATRRWGVLNYLLKQKDNDSQNNKKKLFDRDDLPIGSKLNASVRSHQEEFVTLTPVESDYKRSVSLSSVSRGTSSSDDSELGTFGEVTAEGNNTKII